MKLIKYLENKFINLILGKDIHISPAWNKELAFSDPTNHYALVGSEKAESSKESLDDKGNMHVSSEGKGIPSEGPIISNIGARKASLSMVDDSFVLKLNGKNLCIKRNALKFCKDPTLFDISESKYGFMILENDSFDNKRCLTIFGNGLRLGHCDLENLYQNFTFIDRSLYYCKFDSLGREKYQKPLKELTEKQMGRKIEEAVRSLKPSKSMEDVLKKVLKRSNSKKWKWGIC